MIYKLHRRCGVFKNFIASNAAAREKIRGGGGAERQEDERRCFVTGIPNEGPVMAFVEGERATRACRGD